MSRATPRLPGAALLLLACGCVAGGERVYTTPPPAVASPAEVAVVHPAAAHAPPREVLITLDAVFRLAEHHNPRLALAREQLNESLISQEQACACWLPNTYAGVAYYRHEGGIQNENGTLTNSSTGALSPGIQIQTEIDRRESVFQQVNNERKVWQSKAEVSKVNNEVLLDAANAYIDLLTAQRGEALLRELGEPERRLLARVEKIAKEEVGARSLVDGIKGSLVGREQALSKLRLGAKAASAKLGYLLGLPPETTLRPAEPIVAPFELVDVAPGTGDLVAKALNQGPGVQELEGILRTIQNGIEAGEALKLLPNVVLNVGEGGFGAGPGSSLAWRNRLDVGVAVRWNLSAFQQADYIRRAARSKQDQAALTLADVRGKLAAGVEEARESVLSSREQMGLAVEQIKLYSESYKKVNSRFEEGVEGTMPGDVLVTIKSLDQAYFTHLNAISAHNKAQVRLLLLTGCERPSPRPAPVVAPVAPADAAPPEKLPPPKKEKDMEKAGGKDVGPRSLPPRRIGS